MRGRVACALLACAVLLSACTEVKPGSPTTGANNSTTSGSKQPAPSSTGSTGSGGSDAPKVDNPVDVAKYVEEPCLGLTSAQLGELGLDPGVPRTNSATGETCLWRNSGGASVDLAFLERGLQYFYDIDKTGQYELFEEIPPIEGHPAVIAMNVDNRDTGECALFVGTSDSTVLSVASSPSLSNRGAVKACDVTTRVAGLIMKTVLGAG